MLWYSLLQNMRNKSNHGMLFRCLLELVLCTQRNSNANNNQHLGLRVIAAHDGTLYISGHSTFHKLHARIG